MYQFDEIAVRVGVESVKIVKGLPDLEEKNNGQRKNRSNVKKEAQKRVDARNV